MSSTSYWRKRSEITSDGSRSPVRPSEDLIERLSPEPLYESHHHRSQASWNRYHTLSHETQGLGLSNVNTRYEEKSDFHPDHIYLDQDGGAHIAGRFSNSPTYYDNYNQEHETKSLIKHTRPYDDAYRPKTKGHTRSGSTIDDLASAAIATSPSFANNNIPTFSFQGSPSTYSSARPATSYMNGQSYDNLNQERPAKRIKSEKLPSSEWSPRQDRPRSSYRTNAETTQEEIDLLLNLKYGTHFHASTPEDSRLSHTLALPSITPTSASLDVRQRAVKEDITAQSDPVTTQPESQAQSRSTETRLPDVNAIETTRQEAESTFVPGTEASGNETTMTDAITRTETILPTKKSPKRNEMSPDKVSTKKERHSATPDAAPERKRPRRVKPEVQAEVCAHCKQLQRDTDEDQTTMLWISCNACERWYHSICAGFRDKREARSVDKFVCKDCEPEHGTTTFVRKSSRPRTAIDYAGLNEGVVKSSADTSMHHYIQPIKDGRITFLPDD